MSASATASSLQIPLLTHDCFGGVIGKPSDGQLSLCFEGYLLLPHGRRRAYFKTDPAGYAMLNEEIGYVLARAANLPQPQAAKIWINGAVLHRFDPTRWPNPLQHGLCWVTHEAKDRLGKPAPTVKARLKIASGGVTALQLESMKKLFLNFKLLGRLIAFDAWVANVDRNVGNVLLVSADSFVIIDHGQVLGGSTWPQTMHDAPGTYVPTIILDLIFDPPEKALSLPAKNAIVKECEHLSQAYDNALPWLAATLHPSRGPMFQRAHAFLQARATGIQAQMRHRTGLVT